MGKDVLIREASTDEVQNWDGLVRRFANYRIFHTTGWIKSVEAFSGAKPLYLIFEKGGQIVACLPGFPIKIAFLRLFASPREGWQTDSMGPVFDPAKISTKEMIEALIVFLEREYQVQHLELVCPGLDRRVMEEMGFRGEPLFTYRVQLFPNEEDRVIKNMHSRARSYIRSTLRSRLITQVRTEESFVNEIYAQLKEVFVRNGKTVPFNKNRIIKLFRHMKEYGNPLCISIHEPDARACIAIGVFLVEGKEICLWSWTHRSLYARYHPTELLVWKAMQKGMEAGCTTFDFGGGARQK
jgi:CelD/BcsL family acetyltransferase involved in cellulose biosynthesis